LADWLARRKQPLAASLAVQVGLVLAETLAAIHAQGLLHRNLKPSNVQLRLATPAGPDRPPDLPPDRPIAPEFPYQPVIVDFDLPSWAELVHSTLVATSIEQLPVYLAPEQIERTVETLSAAVDVYGLGGLLYEMLAGRCPFAASRLEELVRQILQQPPPPLSRLGVPVELEQIVSTCLRKQPELRYPSVQRLADDLRRVQAGQKPVGVPLGFWHRLAQFWRQRKRS
jgi:serine/threonine-protein kinase